MYESSRKSAQRRSRSKLRLGIIAIATLVGSMPVTAAVAETGAASTDNRTNAASTAHFEESLVFKAGELGYACFRIPGVVQANDGTILAFAEGRVASCADDGHIDVVVRRSADGGRTWGPIQVIDEGRGGTSGNPVPVVDRESGRIAVLSTHNSDTVCRDGCDRDPYLQISEDHGATWSEPRELTDAKKPEWSWWYGTGPGHGIQLTDGPHAGRMLVAATGETRHPDGSHEYGQHLIYSDDGGLTWDIGATTSRSDGALIAGELAIADLGDGQVYIQAREFSGTPGTRVATVSSDSGETFDDEFRVLPDLIAPSVQGSVLTVGPNEQGEDRMLFSSPAHPVIREVMAIRSSSDDGQTWETWEEGKVIHWGPSGYSDLVSLQDGMIGMIYEKGAKSPYETLTFAVFNEAYLETPNGTPPNIPAPPAPGPTTPDASPNRNSAFVRGEAQLTEGRFGNGLQFDGENDYVEVPFNASVDVGADEFTFTSWIRYDETSGSHTIMWAYRMGSSVPQLWLRAEPARNRIAAHMHVGTGSMTLASPGAYNDGEWHFVVLQRVDGRFVLQVDGEIVDSAKAPEGSITAGSEFGVEGLSIGQRVDGADRFEGAMDSVRLYTRGLNATQLDLIMEKNQPIGGHLGLNLQFEEVEAE